MATWLLIGPLRGVNHSLSDQERKDPELRSPQGLSLGSPGALEKAEPLPQRAPQSTSAPLLGRILVTH